MLKYELISFTCKFCTAIFLFFHAHIIISREVYLTTVEALAAIEELTEDDEHQIDLVIAPPEISVVSDEEGLDDNDLTENEMLLPDAAGLIEVHQTTGKKTGDSPQSSSQQAFRKSKFNGTRPKNAKSENVERKIERQTSSIYFCSCQQRNKRVRKN